MLQKSNCGWHKSQQRGRGSQTGRQHNGMQIGRQQHGGGGGGQHEMVGRNIQHCLHEQQLILVFVRVKFFFQNLLNLCFLVNKSVR